MSFIDLYSEHDALLKRKGYDEESLNSPFRKGWMMRELLQYLGRAVDRMFYESDPVDFTLKAVAFFNDTDGNNTDVVQYHFNYRFDPGPEILRLYRLDVQWEGKIKSFSLNINESLPHAKDAFKALKENKQLSMQRSPKIKNPSSKSHRRHL